MMMVSDEDLDRQVQIGHKTRPLRECSEDELRCAVRDAEDRRRRSDEALRGIRRALHDAVMIG
jgi:hypothetical protein